MLGPPPSPAGDGGKPRGVLGGSRELRFRGGGAKIPFVLPIRVQKNTISTRPRDICLHSEYGICMGDLPDDLRTVIEAWDSLSKAVKAGILAMVKTARQA
jgi:hypothetical protein